MSHFSPAVDGQQFHRIEKTPNKTYFWTLLFLFPILPIALSVRDAEIEGAQAVVRGSMAFLNFLNLQIVIA